MVRYFVETNYITYAVGANFAKKLSEFTELIIVHLQKLNDKPKKRKTKCKKLDNVIVGVRFTGKLSIKFKEANRWCQFSIGYRSLLEKFLEIPTNFTTPNETPVKNRNARANLAKIAKCWAVLDFIC